MRRLIHLRVGLQPAARGAGARQHRIDGPDGKITALKSATNSLLTQLQTAASTNGDVYVSIVPFVKDVNLGAGNWNSDWIYWDDAAKSDNNSWDANNGTCSVSGYSDRSQLRRAVVLLALGLHDPEHLHGRGHLLDLRQHDSKQLHERGHLLDIGIEPQHPEHLHDGHLLDIGLLDPEQLHVRRGTCSNAAKTTQSSCTSQKACSKSQYTSQNNCQNNGGTWGFGTWTTGVWTAPGTWTAGTWTAGTWTPGTWNAATWTPNNHSTWNGCVVDRGNPTATKA